MHTFGFCAYCQAFPKCLYNLTLPPTVYEFHLFFFIFLLMFGILFFILAILVVESFLICILPKTTCVAFICVLNIWIFSFLKCLFKSFVYFSIGSCAFFLTEEVLYILWVLVFCICVAGMFSLVCLLSSLIVSFG